MIPRFRDRRAAQALQKALERHERLLRSGVGASDARTRAAKNLTGETAHLFSMGTAMAEVAAPMPEPDFVESFAARLASFQTVTVLRLRPTVRRPSFAFAYAAAAIAVFAVVLVPAFRSLPGDGLYSLKRASETVRVAIVGGQTEAHLRIDLAAERFHEVERLVDRAETHELSPGLAAVSAPTLKGITDVHVVELIRETFQDAQEQIEVAAEILIAQPTDAEGLDRLVQVAKHGREIAEVVVVELPQRKQPPVLDTVVTLAKIEAEAKAARMQVVEPTAEPTIPPCDTPTPAPTATASGDATTATPTAEPKATPCVSPTPEPTQSPTAEPVPAATPAPASPEPTTQTAPQGADESQARTSASEPDHTASP